MIFKPAVPQLRIEEWGCISPCGSFRAVRVTAQGRQKTLNRAGASSVYRNGAKIADLKPDRQAHAMGQAFLTQAVHQPLALTDLPWNSVHGPSAAPALPE
jgi:hypothetical protein